MRYSSKFLVFLGEANVLIIAIAVVICMSAIVGVTALVYKSAMKAKVNFLKIIKTILVRL